MTAGRQILDAKLALEQELVAPLYIVGRQYIKAWADNGGAMASFQRGAWQQRFEQVLSRHYARTVMVMTGRRPPRHPDLQEAALSLQHMESLIARAKGYGLLMLAGIDRDLALATSRYNDASDDGTDNFAKDMIPGLMLETKDKVRGVTAGYVMRAVDAAKQAAARLKGKIGTHANVNTNAAAEEARFEYVLQQNASGQLMHEWNCMLDGRVRHPPRSRFDHLAPHGQTVGVREPFEVSGQRLRFPGDTHLGASLGNIMGCRCWARYFLRKADGTDVEVYEAPSAPAQRIPRATDRPGVGSRQYNPTTVVTLNPNTRARVILGSGEVATLRVEQPGLVTVRLRGDTIARARFVNGKVTEISIAPQHRGADIEGLIRRSVEHSAARGR